MIDTKYLQQYANGIATTDRILEELHVLLEAVRVLCFDQVHALAVEILNRLPDTSFVLIVEGEGKPMDPFKSRKRKQLGMSEQKKKEANLLPQ